MEHISWHEIRITDDGGHPLRGPERMVALEEYKREGKTTAGHVSGVGDKTIDWEGYPHEEGDPSPREARMHKSPEQVGEATIL